MILLSEHDIFQLSDILNILELSFTITEIEALENLLTIFPITFLIISEEQKYIIPNHMFYDIQFLNEILELLSMDCSSKVEIEESKDEDQDPEKKLGKPPLHELYPEIIKLIQDCLDLNTQSMAENRRRNEVKYMVGVTAIQLKEHIEKNLAKALESPFK